jgi:hypothetical protein
MACARIFSGAFPEIMKEIIQYLDNDFSSLHSCILVNRLWCRSAIPLLWEDPFSIATRNYHFIEIYLHELNDDEKTKLINYRIRNNIIPLNVLFNYSSFIKKLNLKHMVSTIEIWLKEARIMLNNGRAGHQNYKECLKLIFEFLFKIFINNARLHTFEVVFIGYRGYTAFFVFKDVIDLLLNNLNFIRSIKNLIFSISEDDVVTTIEYLKIEQFLSFISSNCNLIRTLDLKFKYRNYNNDGNVNIESDIIKSQNNLKQITFNDDFFNISNKLELLKNLNNTNSLKTIIFNEINFTNVVNIKKIFEQLDGLESFHIINCLLPSDSIEQFLSITKPVKLRSLFINTMDDIERIQSLLEIYGENLENIKFGKIIDKEKIIKLMIKHCPKIRYFELREFARDQNILSAFDFIKNIGCNLNYLIIILSRDYDFGSTILLELGQILPKKLKYLNLEIKINFDDFKIFLNNSRDTFIEKLLISNKGSHDENDEKILIHLKEHNLEIKRINYLAYIKGNSMNLSSIKNEAKEFRSYGIRVLNYFDSAIKFDNFVKEMY